MFNSCNTQLPMHTAGSQAQLHRGGHNTSYKSAFGEGQRQGSQGSFLTALDQHPPVPEQQLMGSSAHFPSRHTDSLGVPVLGGPIHIDEVKKFEDLFIDSQRKHSAPVNSSNQRVVEPPNPFNTTLNEPRRTSIEESQQPVSFNNT